MPKSTKLTFSQGNTYRLLLNLTDSNYNPINITDIAFTASVKETYSSPTAIANFSIEKVSPYSSGSFYIVMDSGSSVLLEAQDYVYDLIMLSGSVLQTLIEGTLIVRPSVTRI